MKATYEQITPVLESSFSVLQLSLPRFGFLYHYHPELELSWIKKSSGKRYVGGNVEEYSEDDLVLIGSNTPHCWLSSGEPLPDSAQAIVFLFKQDFAGKSFWELPELTHINSLFDKAKAGLRITGVTRQQVIQKMELCANNQGFTRLLSLIEILQLIAVSSETEAIDARFGELSGSLSETERFQKVFSYLIQNYREEITLEKIAEVAHLTPSAFCRFFKNVTHKTLFELIVEFRVSEACRLLRSTDKPVAEICFECGFGNLSYFNKAFKAATGNSPLNYRRLY